MRGLPGGLRHIGYIEPSGSGSSTAVRKPDALRSIRKWPCSPAARAFGGEGYFTPRFMFDRARSNPRRATHRHCRCCSRGNAADAAEIIQTRLELHEQ